MRRLRRWFGIWHTHVDPDGHWVFHRHLALPLLHARRGVKAAHPKGWLEWWS